MSVTSTLRAGGCGSGLRWLGGLLVAWHRGISGVDAARTVVLKVIAGVVALTGGAIASGVRAELTMTYVAAPPDNPLKGLVPYAGGDKRPLFPHSMEFNSLPLSDLMLDMDEFSWDSLEKLLDDVASRGHQTVFRVWMVYPGHTEGIPEFLVRDGLKVTEWLNTNTHPFPAKMVRTPDYDDPRMRDALKNFLAAFGRKYDGDPRIGFVTAGLLGTWGEWHEYPRGELFASKETQAEVMDAYEGAFRITPILLRYPAGEGHWHYASNSTRPFGYHDDSFAWATLETGRVEDDWFFVPSLTTAGESALNKWQTKPIGGEIRPELWGRIFDDNPDHPQGQDFAGCVRATHVTWLMDTGMFQEKQSEARIRNAIAQVRTMGYEFHVFAAKVERVGEAEVLRVGVRNTGIAPFYYDWPLELGFVDAEGDLVECHPLDGTLTRILPDQERTWSTQLPAVPAAARRVAIRVKNPLPNGLPLKFANARQQDTGWLEVAELPKDAAPADTSIAEEP